MQDVDCYKEIGGNDDLSVFVTTHGPLIKKIANHIKCRLPATIDVDDLIQAGLIGLLEAKNNFSTEAGASFETYAAIKIRGAMIDELRRNTGITRDISQNMKSISLARSQLENSATDDIVISSKNIADKLGVTEKRYSHMVAEINAYHSISINDVEKLEEIACPESIDPMELLNKNDIKLAVKSVISSLPKREQHILALYYNEQLNFKEIASILDLTEARISQLHSLALDKVRRKYRYFYD